MTKKQKILIISVIVIGLAIGFLYKYKNNSPLINSRLRVKQEDKELVEENVIKDLIKSHPLSIEQMRKQEYLGSDITIEQTLSPGSNYNRYLTSYKSEGLKIYALLTIPKAKKPEGGWPAIIFNHGYIPPSQYRTTEKYIAYTDAFSRNGYVLFRPDYRGHGNSEGSPEGAYYSPAYTVDVLNALASVKKHSDVNAEKIGMWGHSMGGSITLRSMVVRNDIKAGVIWAGVVGSYEDMANNWHRRTPAAGPSSQASPRRRRIQDLIDQYGEFGIASSFWREITPILNVDKVSGPIQLHHGTADSSVPLVFSEKLKNEMIKANKSVELYTYQGDDHNISRNLGLALSRSVKFFDEHLK